MVIKVRTDKRKRKPAKSMGGRLARVGQQYTTKGGYAYSAFKLARRLADAVNIEYKERDTASSVTPTNNGTVVSLAGNIIQGDSQAERVGDSIKLQNLTMRMLVTPGASATEYLRVIVFHDKQNTISTGANMLALVGSAQSIISPKNEDNKYQSRILYDKVIPIVPTSARAVFKVHEVFPLNWHCHYSAGTTTVKDGDIKVLFISNTVAASTASIFYNFQLSYTDN